MRTGQPGEILHIDYVDGIGTSGTLSKRGKEHRFYSLMMKHVCVSPKLLCQGDDVVVRNVTLNGDVSVQAACGCTLLLYEAVEPRRA